MARRSRIVVNAFAAWTAFVWVTRINNALADATLDAGAKAVAVGLALSMLGLAAVSVWSARTSRSTPVIQIFAAWTIVVWAVRVPQILLSDHAVSFKVVHSVLGVVSVALAVAAWAATSRRKALPRIS